MSPFKKAAFFVLVVIALAAGFWFMEPSSPVTKIKGTFPVEGVIIYTEMKTHNGKDYFQEAVFAYSIEDSTFWSHGELPDSLSVQYPGNELLLEVKVTDTSSAKVVSINDNFSANNKQEYIWNVDNKLSKITFINSIAFYSTYINGQYTGGFYALAVLDNEVLTLLPLKEEGLVQEDPLPLRVISTDGYTESLIDEETGQVFL